MIPSGPFLPIEASYISEALDTGTYPFEEFYHLKNKLYIVDELLQHFLSTESLQGIGSKRLMASIYKMYNPNWLGDNWSQQQAAELGHIFYKYVCLYQDIEWKSLEYIPRVVAEHMYMINLYENSGNHHFEKFIDVYDAMFAIKRLLQSPAYKDMYITRNNTGMHASSVSKLMFDYTSENYELAYDWWDPKVQKDLIFALGQSFLSISDMEQLSDTPFEIYDHFKQGIFDNWSELSVSTRVAFMYIDLSRFGNYAGTLDNSIIHLTTNYTSILSPEFFKNLETHMHFKSESKLTFDILLEVYTSSNYQYVGEISMPAF